MVIDIEINGRLFITLGELEEYVIEQQATIAALREGLGRFCYMRWAEVERVAHEHVMVRLITEGHGTELGHVNAEDLITARALLATVPEKP